MNQEQFKKLIQKNIVIGKIFNNPSGRGTSTIIGNNGETIIYQRGKSKLYIKIEQLWDVYQKFLGNKLESTDLREFRPKIYDSKKNGHSCHCTTLFLILQDIGIVDTINGKGVSNNPFWIQL